MKCRNIKQTQTLSSCLYHENPLFLTYRITLTVLHFIMGKLSLYVTNIRKLQLLQKKAIRIITSSHYIAHTDPLFSTTKLLKLDDLYKYQLGIFTHKVTHCQLPQNISSMFLRTDNIRSHKLRNQNAYYIQQIRANTRKIHNKLFWTEILEHSSCQSSTTCFHTPV